MPSLSDIEDLIEENLPRNLQELPHKISVTVHEYYDALYTQLTKYGPPLPNLPSLPEGLTGKVQEVFSPMSAPPPAPPPPPPPSTLEIVHQWIKDHRRGLSVAGGVLVLGFGTRAAYLSGAIWLPGLGRKQVASNRRTRKIRTQNGIRREAVIVLGGDTPIGRSMALHFSGMGFIVLASVSSSSALAQFETHIPPSSRGYVKAVVFDTSDPTGSLQPFIRALNAALSLRYPLTSAGDPYARPGENVSIAGVVNALGFLSPEDDALAGSRSMSTSSLATSVGSLPMSRLSPDHTSELLDKHVVSSLCVLGSLLPLLRSLPNRSDDQTDLFPAAVINLVSSPASRTSLPRQGVLSVVAQGFAAGVQSLRRECEEDSLNSKAGYRVASNAGSGSGSGRRQARDAGRPLPKQRDVRVTVVEINSGSLLGGSPASASDAQAPLSSSSTMVGSSTRPSLARSASTSSQWHHRSPAAAPVLQKVSDLLLSPKRRLKPSYTVGTRTVSAYWLAITHSFLSMLPTSFVDIVLALRRQLSLRRAGLIGRAEHAFSAAGGWAASRGQTPRSGDGAGGGYAGGPGPGPASRSHLRTSLEDNQVARRATQAGYDTRDSDAQSLPESERSSGLGSGSGLPSSVTSSAYGDHDGDAEVDVDAEGDETGVEASPLLSSSQHSSSQSDSRTTLGSASAQSRAGTGPADLWMGAAPSSRGAASPANYASENESRATDSPLGASWVALDESQSGR
ncbi:uncharacterized protein PFL1_00306 [Pseudozyma flocculosa PF-1]|uniref:Uncharacterized protein n=1 Tax=Pseudozyma flocculosa TaxID=84751 RepID=A0A5C3ERV2_9BASI|nr:uncharacterized protein PFL1_00306 [Pseudozyma flocculosa PF-1]EPQ32109.1 hypothetical protein PFL1_00306 [Pseudozyma flocculosa PF-1]SPO34958.1 uncharacterized protein PSFLO_00429 [Pseudozyma flocculosa]